MVHRAVAEIVWGFILQRFENDAAKTALVCGLAHLLGATGPCGLIVSQDFYATQGSLLELYWHNLEETQRHYFEHQLRTLEPAHSFVLKEQYLDYLAHQRATGFSLLSRLDLSLADRATPAYLAFLQRLRMGHMLSGWMRCHSGLVWSFTFSRPPEARAFTEAEMALLREAVSHLRATAPQWCVDLRGFTPREAEVIRQLATQQPHKQCAQFLRMGLKTFEKHVESIREKLRVASTWEILPAIKARTKDAFQDVG